MAYSAPLAVITGDLATAAQYNTYTKDSIIAMYAGAISVTSQATNDVIVATSSTQLGRTPNISVAQGGTGVAALTANSLLLGAGTSDVTFAAPGSNGNVLTSNGTVWASAAAAVGGKVLQVVSAVYGTAASSSSATAVDTGLTATITPASTSNKVLVIICQAGVGKDTGNAYLDLRAYRGATEINKMGVTVGYTGSSIALRMASVSCVVLDSPSSTSAVTYKTKFASAPGVAQVFVQKSGEESTIALIEIAG